MRSRPMLQVWQKADANESEEASILADWCWYSWPIDQGGCGVQLELHVDIVVIIVVMIKIKDLKSGRISCDNFVVVAIIVLSSLSSLSSSS